MKRMKLFARGAAGDDEVYVEVTPTSFAVRSSFDSFTCAAEAGPTTGIGIPQPGVSGYVPPSSVLPLFSATEGTGASAPSRYGHLRALLSEALRRAAGPVAAKHPPRVVFYGASSLDGVLHGYQYELLRRAVLEAGARTVRFTEKVPNMPPAGYDVPVSLAELTAAPPRHSRRR
jgi:hypothetical protein